MSSLTFEVFTLRPWAAGLFGGALEREDGPYRGGGQTSVSGFWILDLCTGTQKTWSLLMALAFVPSGSRPPLPAGAGGFRMETSSCFPGHFSSSVQGLIVGLVWVDRPSTSSGVPARPGRMIRPALGFLLLSLGAVSSAGNASGMPAYCPLRHPLPPRLPLSDFLLALGRGTEAGGITASLINTRCEESPSPS